MDTLCINQEDLPEWTQQVLKVSDIFSADLVLAQSSEAAEGISHTLTSIGDLVGLNSVFRPTALEKCIGIASTYSFLYQEKRIIRDLVKAPVPIEVVPQSGLLAKGMGDTEARST